MNFVGINKFAISPFLLIYFDFLLLSAVPLMILSNFKNAATMLLIFFKSPFVMVLPSTSSYCICLSIANQYSSSISLILFPISDIPLVIVSIKMFAKSMSLIIYPISNIVSLVVVKTLSIFAFSQILLPVSMIFVP